MRRRRGTSSGPMSIRTSPALGPSSVLLPSPVLHSGSMLHPSPGALARSQRSARAQCPDSVPVLRPGPAIRRPSATTEGRRRRAAGMPPPRTTRSARPGPAELATRDRQAPVAGRKPSTVGGCTPIAGSARDPGGRPCPRSVRSLRPLGRCRTRPKRAAAGTPRRREAASETFPQVHESSRLRAEKYGGSVCAATASPVRLNAVDAGSPVRASTSAESVTHGGSRSPDSTGDQLC